MDGPDRSQLVIVALPSQGDYVRKISSEEEPHLTLLYLGENHFDADQMELLTGYVQFAASMLGQFTLEVERRGELGDKNADVLFFYKNWTKDILRFRDNLLRNDLVMTAYQSVDQYPEWTPHLTLGYPDKPAKKDPLDHREITYVTFDRIALWTGEFKGATFPLKSLRYETEVSMAQIDRGRQYVDDVLAHSGFNLEDEYGGLLDLIQTYISEPEDEAVKHYGIKGMKWGVRKADETSTRAPLKSLGPDSVSRKTASGETITLKKMQPTKLHNLLGRMSKKYREEYSKGATLDILDGSGKKVGDAIVEKKNDDELYLNWLGIDKSARGKGYATAVMKAGRDFGKQQGFKRMTLEVPGNSPDARHIYEKLGFKVTKEADGTDDTWGGLTEMAYEFDAAHSSLAHYGTKGMKWGVRRDRGHEGEQATVKKIAKLDQKFERNAGTIDTMIKVNNRAADLTNKNDIDRINNKPAYKDADFSRDTPLRRKYYKEHQKAFINNLEKAADELGTNASGTKKYRIFERPDGDWNVELSDVKHAAIPDDETFSVNVEYDSSGQIIKIVIPEDSMVQSEETVTDFLKHYGIKGMKWGVRRSQSELAKQPPSDDFAAARASAAKAKAGGIKTLSNKELQDLNNRLNLEKQYKNLSKKTKSKGQKAVEELLLNFGKQEASKILSKYANKGISNLLGNS